MQGRVIRKKFWQAGGNFIERRGEMTVGFGDGKGSFGIKKTKRKSPSV